MSEKSIFSHIIDREIPAQFEYEDDKVVVIQDIQPAAPVHLLVIPKDQQYADVVELASGDPELLGHMTTIAAQMAEKFCSGEFRFVFNTGVQAGQTVFHVHGHILGNFTDKGLL